MRKVQISSSVNVRVDDHVNHCFVVRSLACGADYVVVFLQHLHSFSKVGGILEKRTSAQLVKVILPDLLNVLGAYLGKYPLCFYGCKVGVAQTVSIYRLFTEVFAYLNGVAKRVQIDTNFNSLNAVQRTLNAVNYTAQTQDKSVILAAPILAKRHVRDKLRLNVVVVVVNELAVSLVVEVDILLHITVKSELIL